jgi:hypothetical protein
VRSGASCFSLCAILTFLLRTVQSPLLFFFYFSQYLNRSRQSAGRCPQKRRRLVAPSQVSSLNAGPVLPRQAIPSPDNPSGPCLAAPSPTEPRHAGLTGPSPALPSRAMPRGPSLAQPFPANPSLAKRAMSPRAEPSRTMPDQTTRALSCLAKPGQARPYPASRAKPSQTKPCLAAHRPAEGPGPDGRPSWPGSG